MIAMGYSTGSGVAPNISTPGHGEYLAVHTVILSHARAYRLYEREFKAKQGGEWILVTLVVMWVLFMRVTIEASTAQACNFEAAH
jgi:lactase-phlorizin hydrolase